MATWALTKVAVHLGEGEKVDPLSRWRAVLGTCDARCTRRERGASPAYWPIWVVPAFPPSTTRARELVADKSGSTSRIRTYNRLVNEPWIT